MKNYSTHVMLNEVKHPIRKAGYSSFLILHS